jgi:hypothetical protein
VLVGRLVEGAQGQGISEEDLREEVGDLTDFVRSRLTAANKTEGDRTHRRK